MKFTSSKRVVRNISIEQLKLKIEKIAKPKIQIETLDQIDVYEVNLRVRIKGKGDAFYTEIPTTITLKNTKRGIEIISSSNLLKPLLFSIGLALTTGLLYFSVYKNWNVIFPCSIVLIITFGILINSIRRRATELLMQIK